MLFQQSHGSWWGPRTSGGKTNVPNQYAVYKMYVPPEDLIDTVAKIHDLEIETKGYEIADNNFANNMRTIALLEPQSRYDSV